MKYKNLKKKLEARIKDFESIYNVPFKIKLNIGNKPINNIKEQRNLSSLFPLNK